MLNILATAITQQALGNKDIQHNLNEKYAHMRDEYNSKQQQLSSIDEARKNKLNLWE